MKTAMITGCNRGLGRALMDKFASEHFNIVACARKQTDEFTTICHEIADTYHVQVTPLYFDLTEPAQIETAMAELEAMGMDIDVLINNAGMNITKPLLTTDYEDLMTCFRVNYFAPVMISKAVANLMVHQGQGCIVNITSIVGLGQQPGGSCYGASKAALNRFTISAAQELAPMGVRVNAIACGPMDSEMFYSLPENLQKKWTKSIALKRLAQKEEIVNIVYLLASEQASYMVGQIVRVDGGAVV
jgi:3-oxoacyl-[acyl-carrier protein] reductase